jgi:hypothetical protein
MDRLKEWRDIMRDNVKGSLDQLKGAIESLEIEALQPLLPTLNKVVNLFSDFVTEHSPAIEQAFRDIGNAVQKFLDPYLKPKNVEVKAFANLESESMIPEDFHDLEAASIRKPLPNIVTAFGDQFSEWINGPGQQILTSFIEKTTDYLAGAIKLAAPTIGKAALSIGEAIGTSMIQALGEELNKSALGRIIMGAAVGGTVAGIPGAILGGVTSIVPTPQPTSALEDAGIEAARPNGSHANGLSYVPFNGYRAELHQGERVLTAQENRQYNNSSSGVLITGNTFHVRQESDIDSIARALSQHILTAGGAGA